MWADVFRPALMTHSVGTPCRASTCWARHGTESRLGRLVDAQLDEQMFVLGTVGPDPG